MSWDIFVQDFPERAKSVAEIPRDFPPPPLGPRADIASRIKRIVPQADFTDQGWAYPGRLVVDRGEPRARRGVQPLRPACSRRR
jgi:hypothetical protein